MIRAALAATLVAVLTLTSGCGESDHCKALKQKAEEQYDRSGDSPLASQYMIDYVSKCKDIYDD